MIEELPINQIICGDCIDELQKIPENSIDLIATDPPYGLSFMGKEWDDFKATRVAKSQVITNLGTGMRRTTKQENLNYHMWVTAWGEECLRVLKSGAFIFYCMSPRQDLLSRAMIALEDAGFDVGFTSIFWAYASGFPKASNIGKLVDKRMGTYVEGVPTKNARFSERTTEEGSYSHSKVTREFTAQSSEAKELDGSYSGFQPKPAVEVIIVAMKPLSEKTYVEQALKNRKGITWLDNCRIPYKSDYDQKHQDDIQKGQLNADRGKFFGGKGQSLSSGNLQGRFPANLLVSDDALNDGRIRQSIKSTQEHSEYGDEFKFGGGVSNPENQYNDSGSFSRYFDLSRWFIDKLKELPEGLQDTFPFLIVPKASKAEKNKGLEQRMFTRKCRWNNAGEWKDLETTNYGNNHPTVKPLDLMSYLITLGSREDDIILDLFAGSGTTCMAAKILRRNYIGIELNKDYCDIAESRIDAVNKALKQTKLF